MVVASPPTWWLTACRIRRRTWRLTIACPSVSSAAGCSATRRAASRKNCKVGGSFECNDGAVLHEWALARQRDSPGAPSGKWGGT